MESATTSIHDVETLSDIRIKGFLPVPADLLVGEDQFRPSNKRLVAAWVLAGAIRACLGTEDIDYVVKDINLGLGRNASVTDAVQRISELLAMDVHTVKLVSDLVESTATRKKNIERCKTWGPEVLAVKVKLVDLPKTGSVMSDGWREVVEIARAKAQDADDSDDNLNDLCKDKEPGEIDEEDPPLVSADTQGTITQETLTEQSALPQVEQPSRPIKRWVYAEFFDRKCRSAFEVLGEEAHLIIHRALDGCTEDATISDVTGPFMASEAMKEIARSLEAIESLSQRVIFTKIIQDSICSSYTQLGDFITKRNYFNDVKEQCYQNSFDNLLVSFSDHPGGIASLLGGKLHACFKVYYPDDAEKIALGTYDPSEFLSKVNDLVVSEIMKTGNWSEKSFKSQLALSRTEVLSEIKKAVEVDESLKNQLGGIVASVKQIADWAVSGQGMPLGAASRDHRANLDQPLDSDPVQSGPPARATPDESPSRTVDLLAYMDSLVS